MTSVNLSVGVALVAVQAVSEQLQLMRARAACDRRWAPEVARLEHARAELDKAINEALAIPQVETCQGCGLQLAHCAEDGRSTMVCLTPWCEDRSDGDA